MNNKIFAMKFKQLSAEHRLGYYQMAVICNMRAAVG